MKSLTQNVDLIPEAKEATPQGLFTKETESFQRHCSKQRNKFLKFR